MPATCSARCSPATARARRCSTSSSSGTRCRGGSLDRLRELPPDRARGGDSIGGLRATGGRCTVAASIFDLLPVPNYFFQRDPQVVLGDRVMLSLDGHRGPRPRAARWRARSSATTRRSPAYRELFEVHSPPHAAPDVGPAYPFPSLEGGDVLVASPEILLVGDQRAHQPTRRRGACRAPAARTDTSFRWLIAVELPPRRAYMHLDTVFTLIDRGTCIAYLPVIGAGGPESARVYSVDLEADELAFKVQRALPETLAELGLRLDVVPCGGAEDFVEQQREQWTDGANAFAVAPGVIFLYHRNRHTTAELARRGWRILTEEEALATDDLGRRATPWSPSPAASCRARAAARAA